MYYKEISTNHDLHDCGSKKVIITLWNHILTIYKVICRLAVNMCLVLEMTNGSYTGWLHTDGGFTLQNFIIRKNYH